jgi:hypothetical protein
MEHQADALAEAVSVFQYTPATDLQPQRLRA